jgi:hypothetical protein
VLQLNVCAKRFKEHFTGLSVSTRSIDHGLFDADDLIALRALAEAMTRAIHSVPWPKPNPRRSILAFSYLQFPNTPDGLATQVELS